MADDRRFLIRDERAAGELGFALAALEEVRGRTRKAIEGLDPAALSARPAHGGNSIGALARHIALVELDWILTDICRGEPLPRDAPEMLHLEGAMAEPGERPLAEFVEALEYARRVTLDRLGRLPATEIETERTYADERVRRVFNVRWILHHLVVHEAHHLGQIALVRANAGRTRER